ncbi:MAG TPA: PEP-CTERM sorting domain-containing protein [Bryobacteraceae bacterium]
MARTGTLFITGFVLAFCTAQYTKADALFDFETNPSGTPTPFTNTVNGLSATFGGSARVCDSQGFFQSLSGQILIQNFCGSSSDSGPLTISFSSPLTTISFDFAVAAPNGTLSLAAFLGGTPAGGSDFGTTVPPGLFNSEGVANFSGTFDSVELSSDFFLAVDNVDASTTPVPEPGVSLLVPAALAVFAVMRRRSWSLR